MRILHVITRLILGGAQQNTVMCCAHHVDQGHPTALIYGPIYGPEGTLLAEARDSGALLQEMPALRRSIHPWHDPVCYTALRMFIRKHQPDVVHTHSSKAGILGRLAAWHENVPCVVHTVHGLPFHDRQWRAVFAGYVQAEKIAARRCHHLIAITRAMVDAFDAQGIADPSMFTVIPSGLDIARLTPPPGSREMVRKELGIAPDAPVLGIVARFDPLKGQDDLLSIFPSLQKDVPGLKLLMVGDGWDKPRIEQMARDKGIGSDVIFTGLVPQERVAELCSAMDVKALPSYQEGQSRTLLEALLGGAAVVGYDVGGIPEVCRDGQTGRLVPMGDTAALRLAIIGLLRDPAERHRLVTEGRRLVTREYDARDMVRRVEQVYATVLEANT